MKISDLLQLRYQCLKTAKVNVMQLKFCKSWGQTVISCCFRATT